MRIEQIGCTPLKGSRHLRHDTVRLVTDGPAGDRVFCLLDPHRDRVLRTVENPALVQAVVRWSASVLSLDLHGRRTRGVPEPTGRRLTADYWGRPAALEVMDGPWALPLSEHLRREVLLARVLRTGDVVYGAPVSLVTTSSLHELAGRVGRPVQAARFRSTFVVDTAELPPGSEQTWRGDEIEIGSARLRVRAGVPRCAVVNLDPVDGSRDGRVLKALAGHRRDEPLFGVDAVVTVGGQVRVGDVVRHAPARPRT